MIWTNWRLTMTQKLGDFSAQAHAYARARPGYPISLVERLLDRAGVTRGDMIVDIGAGTGLFTRCLSGRGFRVIAIEPNQMMREQAMVLDDVTWQEGAFERTGISDGVAKWVVAAQAFHWADPAIALPEIRRILRPGGHFTVLWNDRNMEASPLLREIQGMLRSSAPAFDEQYRSAIDWPAVLTSTGDFAHPVCDTADHAIRMTRERFLELWKSHNRLNVSIGEQGMSRLLGALADCLDRHGASDVDVHYRTVAWTVTAL
jgi:SAM-dependent methyltransferase